MLIQIQSTLNKHQTICEVGPYRQLRQQSHQTVTSHVDGPNPVTWTIFDLVRMWNRKAQKLVHLWFSRQGKHWVVSLISTKL